MSSLDRFEEKWIRGRASETSALLGSADIQSLADMGNAYSMVRQMRLAERNWVDPRRT
jgi:hypothetical protein